MSAALEHRVDSATGVQVSLPIAGVGVRAYAFVIDWHVRTILGVAWWVIAALAWNALVEGRLSIRPPFEDSVAWFLIVVLPSSAIYFLYHPIVETALRGRTPGKRIAGVRIATLSGGTPSAGALLLRNVFRLIDSLPAFYALGLVVATLSREHRRLGDLAAGTLLVYDRHLVDDFADLDHSAAAVDDERRELAEQLRRRWAGIAAPARRALALRLLEGTAGDPAADDAVLLERLGALVGRPSPERAHGDGGGAGGERSAAP